MNFSVSATCTAGNGKDKNNAGVKLYFMLTSPEVFVSDDKWRTVLQSNVFGETFDGKGSG